MKKIGIFFGSQTGSTERIARKIQKYFGEKKSGLHNIAGATVNDMRKYEHYVFGAPTWMGGDMQRMWETFFLGLKSVDLSRRKVAIFGLGDQKGYPRNFADGIGKIYDRLIEQSAVVLGSWSTNDYHFEQSTASRNESFVGLIIDEENQPELTDQRIAQWVDSLNIMLA